MSQRSSFTSEYIYCYDDYQILREKATKEANHKYLCVAPPAVWCDEMPIIQGKIGCFAPGMEYLELQDFLYGVKTKYPVTFLILPEGHDSEHCHPAPIMKVVKYPDGDVTTFFCENFEEI